MQKTIHPKAFCLEKNSAKQVIEAMNQSADKGFEFWVEEIPFILEMVCHAVRKNCRQQ